MDRHTLESFRARARRVALPEDVRESVLDEVRAEKSERARGPRRPRRGRGGVTRRTFVRAGAVAAGAAAAFLGANALMNRAAGERGNWFALTAYAESAEGPNGSRLALGETFGGHISWSGGVDEGGGGNLMTISTELDLTCTGDNVDTFTYRLEGDNVLTDRDLSESDTYTSPGIWIQWATTYREGEKSSGPVESFTVDYENQRPNGLFDVLAGTNACYAVYANVPVPDDLVPLFLERREISEAQRERSKDSAGADGSATAVETEEESLRTMEFYRQVGVRAAELFAEELAKTSLVMTAAFDDGSDQTKRYGFAPRENFAQVYDDYLAADDEAYLAGDDARRQELADNPPSLYLITELEA